MSLTAEHLLMMYRKMLEIRRFEEKAAELYAQGLIPGLAHPCIGQEAVAVGVCTALDKGDCVLSNHRGHGHSLAKGVPARKVMAELLGKGTGVCKGLGGSMHATDLEHGVIFSTAIVGGNIPIATGVGLALKLAMTKQVAVSFFGDGATNTGSFHEALNLASLWKLPVVFVCENNLYAISMPVERSVSAKTIADRGVAYDMPGVIVDGMDVIAVHEAASTALKRARQGEGPCLLECRTYRFKGHGMYDTGLDYRTKEEIEEWMKRDPIRKLRKKLIEEKMAGEEDLKRIEREVQEIIDDAVLFAKGSPYPKRELMFELVYA